jgi:hypothetical protein
MLRRYVLGAGAYSGCVLAMLASYPAVPHGSRRHKAKWAMNKTGPARHAEVGPAVSIARHWVLAAALQKARLPHSVYSVQSGVRREAGCQHMGWNVAD